MRGIEQWSYQNVAPLNILSATSQHPLDRKFWISRHCSSQSQASPCGGGRILERASRPQAFFHGNPPARNGCRFEMPLFFLGYGLTRP